MRYFITLAIAAFLIASGGLSASDPVPQKPNFIFILVDDMPWYGTTVRMDANLPESAMAFRKMPNVEKLAFNGMIFRNARAAAGMCAPSRCSIMTGMMTAHHLYSGNGGFGPKTDGNVKYLTRPKDAGLPLIQPEPQGNIRFPSVGDVLRPAGYATAHFGKWHLFGGGPEKHGFDESDGETDNTEHGPNEVPVDKKADTAEDPKLMFSITKRSIDFMEHQAKATKPFYLQLSHYATHAHYQARKETLAKYEKDPVFEKIANKREKKNNQLAAAMAEDLDTSIGMLLSKLEALGIAKNTYIIFTADNGYHNWNESHDPLRGAKWWLWEGGVRVPMIIRGPGVTAGTRTAANIVGYDFLPTIADLAGATKNLAKEVDGTSFKPVLFGQPLAESYLNRPIIFHYPHYRVSPPCSAIVVGETKYMHYYEWPNDRFVFNLKTDLAEHKNTAKTNPEQASKLHDQMMAQLKAVGGYFPKTNPNADPKAKRYDPNNLLDKGPIEVPGVGDK